MNISSKSSCNWTLSNDTKFVIVVNVWRTEVCYNFFSWAMKEFVLPFSKNSDNSRLTQCIKSKKCGICCHFFVL